MLGETRALGRAELPQGGFGSLAEIAQCRHGVARPVEMHRELGRRYVPSQGALALERRAYLGVEARARRRQRALVKPLTKEGVAKRIRHRVGVRTFAGASGS